MIKKLITSCICAVALFAVVEISAQNACKMKYTKPFVVSAPKPPYPPKAIAEKIEGDVLIDVLIDASGNVTQAIFVSGNDLLKNAAMASARGWKFDKTETEDSVRSVRLTFSFFLNPDDYEEQDADEIRYNYHLKIYRSSIGCPAPDSK